MTKSLVPDMEKKVIIGFITAFIAFSINVFAQNPIIQTNYTADPAPMEYDGRLYVFTSHDEDSTLRNFFTMNDWRCYSTADMVNWTDHGAVLSYKDFEWARGDAWAGQCIYRNGKFYFYVPVNKKGGWNTIGVAVADTPTGPFKDAIGQPLLEGNGYIDPSVFIDDDGQAYLYWGNPNLWFVKLNEDMLSYDKEVGIVQVPLTEESFGFRKEKVDNRTAAYEEGPWMYKRNDLYYLIYPAGGVPEHLAYSTGKSVTGPWVYKDTIMHVITHKGAFTNHPGLIDFKGNTYLFYHNGALPGGGGFKRSVCVEQIEFNEDGTIPLITPTREGVSESVSNLDPTEKIEAETIAWAEGVETSSEESTGIYVTDIDNNDYIKIRSVDFGKGVKKFEATIAASAPGGRIEIYLDSLRGDLIANMDITSTGGKHKWETLSCPVKKTNGVHDIYLVFKGEGDELFNFDWWKID